MKRHILALLAVGAVHAQNPTPEVPQDEIKVLKGSLLAGFFDVSADKGVLITKAGRYDTEGTTSFVEVIVIDATHIRLLVGSVGKETIASGDVIDATSTLTWKKPFTVVANRWAFWLSDEREYLFDGADELTRIDHVPTGFRMFGRCAYPLVFASAPKPLKEWIERKEPNHSPEPTPGAVH